jgi:hypothetical protein
MNTKLVDSLVEIVLSLTPEEQALLEEKLKAKKTQPNWQEEYQKLLSVRAKIFTRREGKPLEPTPEELIHQMRSERTEQLMQACFPSLARSEDEL